MDHPRPNYQTVPTQPENHFSSLIPHQTISVVPSFTLESGVTLHNVPVAYSVRGQLNAARNNALVICHALSGSSDVTDWWGPLMGRSGRAFDTTRFFIVCLNSLGSPYGSASPVTYVDGDAAKGRYGPDFPLTTIRDDVRLHRLILDDLGVRQVASVVGGSMGGMLVLEWAYFGPEYVRSIVPIATSARHSAWGIGVGEVQRQSIYSDPIYNDGYYDIEHQPGTGLGAARMQALMMYRSRDSFEARFGRNVPDPSKAQKIKDYTRPNNSDKPHFSIHNEGHKVRGVSRPHTNGTTTPNTPPELNDATSESAISQETCRLPQTPSAETTHKDTRLQPQSITSPTTSSSISTGASTVPPNTRFSAQSYLRYQASKFVARFDSNCYIAITRKLDTHDVSYHAQSQSLPDASNPSSAADSSTQSSPVKDALALIRQPALVLGIESDGLFKYAEQKEIAEGIPNSRLRTIESPEGHDAFLLEFKQVNSFILEFFGEVLPDLMDAEPVETTVEETRNENVGAESDGVGTMQKSSTFGEAEVGDITAW